MRPVLLDMDGFASFRDQATVDFTDADYFALVGPTGSGKSTVIDAMIFALYGTVPRWQDKRMVMYALAPTAVRGSVRLVFDVEQKRYVTARELRRAKAGGVQVKSARLEGLVDPTTTGTINDLTEVLAADGLATAAVEKLLGLTFEHFCQCVLLPQGDFAKARAPAGRHWPSEARRQAAVHSLVLPARMPNSSTTNARPTAAVTIASRLDHTPIPTADRAGLFRSHLSSATIGGARLAFCSRTRLPQELVRAAVPANLSHAMLAPLVARRVGRSTLRGIPQPAPARGDQPLDTLTPHEREVLIEFGQGLSNAEIAYQLISQRGNGERPCPALVRQARHHPTGSRSRSLLPEMDWPADPFACTESQASPTNKPLHRSTTSATPMMSSSIGWSSHRAMPLGRSAE